MSTEVIHTGQPLAELMLMEEVAEITRLSMSTLRYYRHAGKGPKSFLIGPRVAYRRSDVIEWIEAQATSDTVRGGVAS